ncbi:hypothetical protein [Microcystis aeruginosa]|uniref:hypothetical protein n=1 Tax=Microcystis aeruginosa TaxID=1126 RepID=UPI001396A41A|nr:hypothetical protein [Microcystis aeruginosa]
MSQSSDSRYINSLSRLDLRSYILRKCFDVTRVPLAALPPDRDRFSGPGSIAPIIEEILDRYLDPVRLILSALSRHFFEFSVITSHIDRAFSAASRAISRISSSSRSSEILGLKPRRSRLALR